MECVYCENPDIQKRIIARNEGVFAIPTYIPIVPGHVLIISNRHIQTITDLTLKETKALQTMVKDMRAALRECFGAEGFNLAINEGPIAGQNVPHFHMHMLPRKAGDTGITDYEPRKFLYRPGSREPTPEAELREVARLIKEGLEKTRNGK